MALENSAHIYLIKTLGLMRLLVRLSKVTSSSGWCMMMLRRAAKSMLENEKKSQHIGN